jgi:DNA repair exonuclease SbcCD ATPase subunit
MARRREYDADLNMEEDDAFKNADATVNPNTSGGLNTDQSTRKRRAVGQLYDTLLDKETHIVDKIVGKLSEETAETLLALVKQIKEIEESQSTLSQQFKTDNETLLTKVVNQIQEQIGRSTFDPEFKKILDDIAKSLTEKNVDKLTAELVTKLFKDHQEQVLAQLGEERVKTENDRNRLFDLLAQNNTQFDSKTSNLIETIKNWIAVQAQENQEGVTTQFIERVHLEKFLGYISQTLHLHQESGMQQMRDIVKEYEDGRLDEQQYNENVFEQLKKIGQQNQEMINKLNTMEKDEVTKYVRQEIEKRDHHSSPPTEDPPQPPPPPPPSTDSVERVPPDAQRLAEELRVTRAKVVQVEATKEMAVLKAEMQAFEQHAHEVKQMEAEKAKQMDQLVTTVQRLEIEKGVAASKMETSKVSTEKNVLDQRIGVLEKDKESLTKTIQTLTTSLDAVRAKREADLEAVRKEKDKEMIELRKQLDTLHQEKGTFTISKQLENALAENKLLSLRQTEFQKDQTLLNDWKQKVAQADATIKRLEGEIQEVKKSRDALVSELAAWKTKAHDYEIEHGVHKEMETLRQSIDQMRTENVTLKSKAPSEHDKTLVKEHEKQVVALQEKIQQLEIKNVERKKAEETIQVLNKELAGKEKEVDKLRTSMHSYEVEHDVHKEMDKLRKEMEHTKVENAQLKATSTATSNKAPESASLSSTKVDALEKEKVTLLQKVRDLEVKMAEKEMLVKQVEMWKKQAEARETEVHTVEKKMHDLEIEHGVHEAMEKLRKENASLKGQTSGGEQFKQLLKEYEALQHTYFKEQDAWRKEMYDLKVQAAVQEKWKKEANELRTEFKEHEKRWISMMKEPLQKIGGELSGVQERLDKMEQATEGGIQDMKEELSRVQSGMKKKMDASNDAMKRSVQKIAKYQGLSGTVVDERMGAVSTPDRSGRIFMDTGGHDASASDSLIDALADQFKDMNTESVTSTLHFIRCSDCSDFVERVEVELNSRQRVYVAACPFHLHQLDSAVKEYERLRVQWPSVNRTFVAYSKETSIY